MNSQFRITSLALSVVALATAFAARSVGQETPPLAADQSQVAAYTQGKSLLESEQYVDAIGTLLRAIRLAPQQTYPEAESALGQAYLKTEDYGRARESFQNALREEESLTEGNLLAETYHGLGQALKEMGDTAGAQSNFQKATELDYQNAQYLADLGAVLVDLGAADIAVKILDRAIELDEELAAAYSARGRAHGLLAQSSSQELDLAFQDFGRAIELDPDDEKIPYSMGLVAFQTKQYEQAIAAFSRSIETEARLAEAAGESPDYAEPITARALALIEVAKVTDVVEKQAEIYRLAIADANGALLIEPNSVNAVLIRGVADRLLKDYDAAIASFTEAIQKMPDFSEAYFRRGIVWYYRDEAILALGDFEDASRINPADVRPYLWQGFTLARQDDFYGAIAAYGLALEKDERNGMAYNNRALAYLQLGQYEKAIGDLSEAIRLAPTDAAAYWKRGVAHALLGDTDKALRSYRDAIHVNPDYMPGYRALAGLYDELGQVEQANDVRQQAQDAQRRLDELAVDKSPPQEPTLDGPDTGKFGTLDQSDLLPGVGEPEGVLVPPAIAPGEMQPPAETEPASPFDLDESLPSDLLQDDGDLF